jgi:N-acyl-D-amino-acid deacylase
VVHRGYGFADIEALSWMQPDHRLRIGSVSKVITLIALLSLLEESKISLDTPFLELLGISADAAYQKITLRHLAGMSAGWYEDRPQDYDIAFGPWSLDMLKKLPHNVPPSSDEALTYMLKSPLDFEPASAYSYSNFTYNTLGLVIEKLGAKPYEEYVQEKIFKPLSLNDCYIGQTIANQYEPKYYVFSDEEFRHFIERSIAGLPYGNSEVLQKNAASGGWVVTAQSLVRLLTAHANKMSALGFDEEFTLNGKPYLLKTGTFSGTQAVVIVGKNGTSFAALFNAKRKATRSHFLDDVKEIFNLIEAN